MASSAQPSPQTPAAVAGPDEARDASSQGSDPACAAACANFVAILQKDLASLGAAGAQMREALGEEAEAECVAACEAGGDQKSVACMAAARTVLELGACHADVPEPH